MRGARGLAVWSAAVTALAIVALLARPETAGVRAAAIACLAAVVGVLATRGLLRRLICLVITLLSAVLLTSGAAVLVVTGTLLALAGLIGVFASGDWPATGRRYEASARTTRPEPGDLWSRIDRGDDPTA